MGQRVRCAVCLGLTLAAGAAGAQLFGPSVDNLRLLDRQALCDRLEVNVYLEGRADPALTRIAREALNPRMADLGLGAVTQDAKCAAYPELTVILRAAGSDLYAYQTTLRVIMQPTSINRFRTFSGQVAEAAISQGAHILYQRGNFGVLPRRDPQDFVRSAANELGRSFYHDVILARSQQR
ncbi:hypothetical protein HNR42_001251 [Deinobacterium chartae]|uniref:Uncharacterized protein n=1 Tax=Deinobacterium chartae TaxID=521158 RepID=A0A841I0N2_9DEIO|nr:hypothetical protein [Deinobacterium chartae]MBB6097828.1 hypothetical protein [Deinobacterium chartae]